MAEIMKMELADWLDDLTVRFLLNLPASELSSVPRLCFQIEEAQWFYEDFVRPAAAAVGNQLPSLPLRHFCLKLFQHCPLLSGFTDAQHIAAYEEFLAYKVRVPVRGAILMDDSMEKLVLVKGWKKGASWSFPRGKINKDEKDLDCAIREVYEETGYDVRHAGLVPEDANDNDVKHIDITMREQHMRLFVFRGVAEDTYFEPKTRKEISKIAWYNVRDLPGFKKQRGGVDQSAQANKFYMVAPFLGPLKKWINQQRTMDDTATAHGSNEPVAAPESAMEDYNDNAAERVPPVEDRSEDLRKLMGVGAGPQAQQAQQTPSGTATLQRPNDLLALLKGGSVGATSGPMPHTPLEQIDTFAPEPKTPHPHNARQSSLPFQHSVPSFPFSPDRLQQQQPQRTYFSAQYIHDHNPGHSQLHGTTDYPPNSNIHQQRQSVPVGLQLVPQYGPQNQGPLSAQRLGPAPPPLVVQHMPPHVQRQPQLDRSALGAQGPQGAIGSGPPVPKAEHLPMPKLNPHSTQLLESFRSGGKTSAQPGAFTTHASKQATQHQNALLDLFKKPISAQSQPAPAQHPVAPSPTVVTERPANLQSRRPTLNEITRTLPRSKVSSPEAAVPPQSPTHGSIPSQPTVDIPRAGPYVDAAKPKQPVRRSPEAPQVETLAQARPVTIMPRPVSTHVPRSPKPRQSRPSDPPSTNNHAKGRENGAPAPSFTILARPGSGRASTSKSQTPQGLSSPFRNETSKPAFQPQVLKRPESVDPITVQKAAESVEKSAGNTEDKRDQLLALFGKPPAAATPTPATQPTSPLTTRQTRPAGPEDRKNSLLNLFSSSAQPSTQGPAPPSAPHLVPERKPSSQNIPHARQPPPPQTALLDLFNRPGSSRALHSPGTPISPFTLGTPVTRHVPQQHQPQHLLTPAEQAYANAHASQLQRRESGFSTVSAGSRGPRREGGSGAATPVEAKGFLLDFLNDVVQKEGHKGARRA